MTATNAHNDPAGWKKRANYLNPRNPFDSPNLSTSSLNDSEHNSVSDQDEFHLEKYNNASRYVHFRQISRSSNGEEKDRKPDLNIITSFAVPKMPMKDATVVVNEVVAKRARTDRKNKGTSIISHKAVQSAVSPSAEATSSSRTARGELKQLRLASTAGKKNNAVRDLQFATKERHAIASSQRVPFGITIPRQDAVRPGQNSALSAMTPVTPAIIVTPAGEDASWTIHRHGQNGEQLSASSSYSAMPAPFMDGEAVHNPQIFQGRAKDAVDLSQEHLDVDSADSARPKSQGWWNLMLSPLLRAGSVASRKGRQVSDTPPVPPLPFTPAKDEFSATSARTDPSFVVSATSTSPDTPRRLGLAGTPASTWSRWTEWEQEREANAERLSQTQSIDASEQQATEKLQVLVNAPHGVGLATEYFHACAVDKATGRSYFECIGHSCLNQLPKLYSIHDAPFTKPLVLESPFQSPLTPEQARAGLSKLSRPADTVGSPILIEDNLSPDELSPNVRQARTATAMKAKALDTSEQKEMSQNKDLTDKAVPSVVSAYPTPPNNDSLPNIATIAPPPSLSQSVQIEIPHEPASQASQNVVWDEKAANVYQPPASLAPMSPESEKVLAPMYGMPLKDLDLKKATASTTVESEKPSRDSQLPGRPAFISAETEYPPLPERRRAVPITASDLFITERKLKKERRRQRHEREDATAMKVGGFWRGRGCLSNNGCMGRGGAEKRTKRRWILAIILLLLTIVITSIVLAVMLTRKGDRTPVQSQWLNLTGYPPMPTGISTIAAPSLVASQKQCITPSTMWSCSVSKEDAGRIGPNDVDQPNLRFEIRFRNGTVPANKTIPLTGQTGNTGSTSNDPFSNDLFVPNPTPPNQADQIFIGRTTDNVTTPFDGEVTPFYITFMSAWPQVPNNSSSSAQNFRRKRDSNSSSLIDAIPAPAKAADGSAAPASLLPNNPFPISQPVKLFNRGLVDEHYGFYIYYDKTIYLSGVKISGNSVVNGSTNPADADQDGGCTKSQASAMCTFSQSRFLFKVFTSPTFQASLLASGSNTTSASQRTLANTSSATNFSRPGSFPYPTTIVVDRHGGDIDKKAVYCYGMNGGSIIDSAKILAGEIRSIGGQLINAAPGIIDTGSDDFNTSAGGIDGGTGGCTCNWQNWQ